MSEEKYIPKSKLAQWFDSRLPLLTLSHHLQAYPTPKNLEIPKYEFGDNSTIKIG